MTYAVPSFRDHILAVLEDAGRALSTFEVLTRLAPAPPQTIAACLSRMASTGEINRQRVTAPSGTQHRTICLWSAKSSTQPVRNHDEGESVRRPMLALRVPKQLRDEIVATAAQSGRSLTEEITRRLAFRP